MHKEPVMGSHYLPHWETGAYGASRSPWRAFCVKHAVVAYQLGVKTMDDFFGALILLSVLGLIVGLIRPRWLRLPSRTFAAGVFSSATIVFFILFGITLPTSIQSPLTDTGSLKEMFPEEIAQAKEALRQRTAATPPKPVEVVPINKQQEAVRAMADFMVKDDNIIGLRMWARSLDTSAPDFASAASLRANISRASNDFALYRDNDELTSLISILANQDAMFIEVLNESTR